MSVCIYIYVGQKCVESCHYPELDKYQRMVRACIYTYRYRFRYRYPFFDIWCESNQYPEVNNHLNFANWRRKDLFSRAGEIGNVRDRSIHIWQINTYIYTSTFLSLFLFLFLSLALSPSRTNSRCQDLLSWAGEIGNGRNGSLGCIEHGMIRLMSTSPTQRVITSHELGFIQHDIWSAFKTLCTFIAFKTLCTRIALKTLCTFIFGFFFGNGRNGSLGGYIERGMIWIMSTQPTQWVVTSHEFGFIERDIDMTRSTWSDWDQATSLTPIYSLVY